MSICTIVRNRLQQDREDGRTLREMAYGYNVPEGSLSRLLTGKREYQCLTLGTFDRMFPNATISLDGEAQGVNVANSGLIANNHSSIHITTDGLKNAIINRILDLEGIPDDILARILKTIRNTEA